MLKILQARLQQYLMLLIYWEVPDLILLTIPGWIPQ